MLMHLNFRCINMINQYQCQKNYLYKKNIIQNDSFTCSCVLHHLCIKSSHVFPPLVMKHRRGPWAFLSFAPESAGSTSPVGRSLGDTKVRRDATRTLNWETCRFECIKLPVWHFCWSKVCSRSVPRRWPSEREGGPGAPCASPRLLLGVKMVAMQIWTIFDRRDLEHMQKTTKNVWNLDDETITMMDTVGLKNRLASVKAWLPLCLLSWGRKKLVL